MEHLLQPISRLYDCVTLLQLTYNLASGIAVQVLETGVHAWLASVSL